MSTVLRPDILIEGPDRSPVAIVEIKNSENLSLAIAADLRTIRLDYGFGIRAPYFLLLSEDTGFLWRESATAGAAWEFSMQRIVSRYLSSPRPAQRLGAIELKLVAWHWLNELAAGQRGAEEEPERSLVGTGFLQAIQGATITFEPAR